MARVVRSGVMVAAYAWDLLGHPWEPIRAMGLTVLSPPRPEASQIEVLRDLWTRAGITAVVTRDITVQRTFAKFDHFWTISISSSSVRPTIAAMTPKDIELLKARVRARLPADAPTPHAQMR